MLAPEGWMFATTWVRNNITHYEDLRVAAVSPSGEIREVARFDPTVDDHRAQRTGTVSVDGFLPVIFDWSDDQGHEHDVIRLFDLHDPLSPYDPDLDPPVGPDEYAATDDWAWEPRRSLDDGSAS